MENRGKELILRSISGIIFVALMVVAFLYSKPLFITLFTFVLAGCLWEFYKLRRMENKFIKFAIFPLFLLSFIFWALIVKSLLGSSYCSDICTIPITPLIWKLFIVLIALTIGLTLFHLIISLIRRDMASFRNLLFSLYILPMFISLPFLLAESGKLTLSLFILIWAGDVGAYCIGTLFGQGPNGHPLIPKISPKKSWEGFIGGLVILLVAALILRKLGWFVINNQQISIAILILLSIILYLASVFGDIVESIIKRRAGVKDSGNIMPGHGGFLDRFDSALIAIPVACIFVIIYLLIR